MSPFNWSSILIQHFGCLLTYWYDVYEMGWDWDELGWDWRGGQKKVLAGVPGSSIIVISYICHPHLLSSSGFILAAGIVFHTDFTFEIRGFHFTNYRFSFSNQISISQTIDFEFILHMNPLHPNISIHILHSFLIKFPKMLTIREHLVNNQGLL